MITVADIGNSCLKIARWDGKSISGVSRVRHRDLRDSDWQAALNEGPAPSAGGVFVASVAQPGVEQVFEAWLLSGGHECPVFLKSTEAAAGVRNAYRKPETLGIDRWCAMIAARSMHGGPICVVDVGTAMTIDWLDGDGQHRGGLILPGPTLQAESLFSNTRHIHLSSGAPAGMFADNTGDGVTAGVSNACAALVDRAYAAMTADLDDDSQARILLTGGDAERIISLLSHQAEVCDDLVLRGVGILAGLYEG